MRQQWNDKRLNFKHRLKGGLEGNKVTIMAIYIFTEKFLFRENKIFDTHRCQQSVDAGYILQK